MSLTATLNMYIIFHPNRSLDDFEVVLPSRATPLSAAWREWLLYTSMGRNASHAHNYSPVKINIARFLPRKGNSTRYPPSIDVGMATDIWISC